MVRAKPRSGAQLRGMSGVADAAGNGQQPQENVLYITRSQWHYVC
jgi:hypothetical protein